MTRAVVSKPLYDLLNKIDPPARVISYCIPTRIVRVTATDETFRAFHVEQLSITSKDPNNPQGNWHTLSSHADAVEGASYPVAMKAAYEAQNDLKRKLEARQAKLMEQRAPRLVRA